MQEYDLHRTHFQAEPLLSKQNIRQSQLQFHKSIVQTNSKLSLSYPLALKLSSFPIVEIAENRNALGVGSPLSVHKLPSFFMNTIFFVALRNHIQSVLHLELSLSLVYELPNLIEVALNKST